MLRRVLGWLRALVSAHPRTAGVGVMALAGVSVYVGSATIPTPEESVPNTANLWMDQNGGTCSWSASPVPYSGAGDSSSCSTAQAACTAAPSTGGTVLIRSGTNYNLGLDGCVNTSMLTLKVADDQDITFSGAGVDNSEFVTIDGGPNMALKTQTVDDAAGVFSECADNVTWRRLEINGAGHDGDAFQIGWPSNCTSSNLRLDGNLVYGLEFKGGNHTDCLQAAVSLDSFIIENNRLLDCGDGALQLTDGSAWGEFAAFTGFGDMEIRNNWINDKINMGTGFQVGPNDVVFQGNTYVGNSSIQFNNAGNQYVYGNILDLFQDFSCTTNAGNGSGGGTTFFRYNVSDVNCPGGTNSTKITDLDSLYVNATQTAAAWDLHLAAGANGAVDTVAAGFYGATDYDGDNRPVGSAGDAGADERG